MPESCGSVQILILLSYLRMAPPPPQTDELPVSLLQIGGCDGRGLSTGL